MGTVEAILHYVDRWALAVFQVKSRNTKRIEELRRNMEELIRLGHIVEREYAEIGLDHTSREEHKFEAIVDRYHAWFSDLSDGIEMRGRAAQILAFTEVYSDYRTIEEKVDDLVARPPV